MGSYYVNVLMNDERMKQMQEAGLADQIKDIGGKKAVQVPFGDKEQKKLVKAFPDLSFDGSNACVLPEQAENTLLGFVVQNKTLDVMKFAILKLYNPLAGKDLRSKVL
jgi:hypothetical protein